RRQVRRRGPDSGLRIAHEVATRTRRTNRASGDDGMMRPLSCTALGVPPWEPAGLPPRASLAESADVGIVGGGLTGLFVPAAVAHPWRDVVVIEQAFGAGATARSGGIVLGETASGPAPDFTGCEESFRQWIAEHKIDCGLEWRGCLQLARNRALSADPVDWHD